MKSLITILFLIFFNQIYSQDSILNWQSFEEVKNLFQQNQRPIMVFLYDDKDPSSQEMFNTTFSNPEVTKYLNYLFYTVKFNVFSTDTLQFFNGVEYVHYPNKQYHSLASEITANNISYPTLVMFTKNGNGRVFPGFKNRDSIFPTLIYYSEEVYEATEYETWEEYYYKAYPPGQKQIISRLHIRWLTVEEMKIKYEQNPKPILIDIYDNYNISATVMRLRTYNNEQIANYLNTNFYCVTVMLRSDEEFELKGTTYKNSGNANKYHQFPYAVLEGNLKFPAFVILDQEMNLIERVQIYMTPEKFNPLIHFYGEEAYKNTDYKNYVKNFNN